MHRTALSAVAFVAVATLPAHATTSSITDAFVAATTPAYEVLRRSDALAETEGASPRLRRFARRDSAEQAAATDELIAWEQAERRADRAAALTPTIDGLGPLLYPFNSVVFPFQVHGHVETDAYRATLAQLSALNGPDLDALYVARQSSTLRRLIEVYIDYIKNGDDPELRALSVRNLPQVRRLLAELGG